MEWSQMQMLRAEKDGCRYSLVRKKLSGIKTGEGRNQEQDQTKVQK